MSRLGRLGTGVCVAPVLSGDDRRRDRGGVSSTQLNPAVEAISAFFPCFNDEPTIASMVRLAVATIERVGVCDAEVIVIDDGSTDGSPQVLAALCEDEPRLSVVTHEENRGYGGALLSGFGTAKKQWVFYTDGD